MVVANNFMKDQQHLELAYSIKHSILSLVKQSSLLLVFVVMLAYY